jgi:hypothetical protein
MVGRAGSMFDSPWLVLAGVAYWGGRISRPSPAHRGRSDGSLRTSNALA